MFTRGRVVLAIPVSGVLLALGACGGGDVAASDRPDARSSTQPPLTADAPSEAEVPADLDESPDGPPPTPDDDLTDADLTALLRTRGSATDDPEKCGTADVAARLSGADAALGHRYTSLVVTNTSSRTCVVEGVPGVGARGEWGRRLTLTVERATPASGAGGAVRLAPGAEARSLVEWTGELAGQGAERASLFVFQLATGQVPVRVPARLTDVPTGADDLDVGMLTTMRLGAFERSR